MWENKDRRGNFKNIKITDMLFSFKFKTLQKLDPDRRFLPYICLVKLVQYSC